MLVTPTIRVKAVNVSKATELQFEWITDHERFLALRDAWNLLASSAVETVFLTHDWLGTWLKELAPDAELHVLTAWDADRLVAALPLFGSQRTGRGRHWAFMGTGTLTPNYLDMISEPASRDWARASFADQLIAASAGWDVLEFDKLPADSETARFLSAEFTRRGLSTTCAVSAVCLYCDLPATYAEYRASRTRATRKKIRETERWQEKEPETRTLACADSEESALSAMRSLERFHQAHWEAKGYPGAFADPRVVSFHERIVSSALAAGSLRMYTLTDADELVAVSYNFRIGSTVQAYLSSYDSRWARSSPGVLLRAFVIEQSIVEGATRFDYLEGAEEYKKAWCTGTRENLRLRIFNRTLPASAFRLKYAADEATVRLARRWAPKNLRERAAKNIARRSVPEKPSGSADR